MTSRRPSSCRKAAPMRIEPHLDVLDAENRATALDTTRSFIVQAPAGSGKTELLIQRHLALLARVERPEAIIAMTFTRKAAGEIRSRIVKALRDAATDVEPSQPHLALTRRLARAALARDRALDWNLLQHPARLQVYTIDALCLALMRQAPLEVKVGATPRFEEHAEAMYIEAARAELAAARSDDPSWQCLLDHTDNDGDRMVRLIANMLAKREQWLPYLVLHERSALRRALEDALATEIELALARIAALFPPAAVGELLELARYAAANADPVDAVRLLEELGGQGGLPAASVNAAAHWRALAQWLLRADKAQFRKSVNRNEGFPAKGKPSEFGHAERDARKRAMETLLLDLGDVQGLASALDQARGLPSPTYDEGAWRFIEALLDVLPRAAARLRVVFAQSGRIDYTEGTLIAVDALGDADAPSELLLALDVRIEHLLIDEFQDTSPAQNQLITLMTSGWSAGDGRTLLLVGDPMQSIYRFREADVELFIAAQQNRSHGCVPLEVLTLARNFRSQAGLVDWVNATFKDVMRATPMPSALEVGFRPAMAVHEAIASPAATFDASPDDAAEAAQVVARVRAALESDAHDVAILVRKRSDLDEILPSLRAAAIPFASVELDRLSQRQAVLDLVSLTHALIQPDDRLAWLATLRAPWCGLTLADLFVVAASARGGSLVDVLDGEAFAEAIAALSPDGRERFRRLSAVLSPTLAERGRVPLATAIRNTWLALGGPACVTEAIDLEAAERFFILLGEHARGSDIADWPAFAGALDALYAEPDAAMQPRVQIMTLHRAKGLEFDVVVMPALARKPRISETQLLLWRRREHGLLLAPMKRRAVNNTDDAAVYAYLKARAKEEDAAELARLLYVGSTRARRSLHLTAVLQVEPPNAERRESRWKPPSSGTALAALWGAIAPGLEPPRDTHVAAARPLRASGVPLLRLPLDWRMPAPPLSIAGGSMLEISEIENRVEFDWAHEAARQTGIVAHRFLHRIAQDGLDQWNVHKITSLRGSIERDAAGLGFSAVECRALSERVTLALHTALLDPRGRWLLDSRHSLAQSEYALTGLRGDKVSRYALDRTFVDADGVRWIVDFKLSTHAGSDLETFLAREQERYREQLEAYAQVMRELDPRPIKLGLYFPLLAGWREWPYAR